MASSMRSPKEIGFRLKQEAANVWLLVRRPAPLLEQECPLARLPQPSALADQLRARGLAEEIQRRAEGVLRHRFPLMGIEINTGPEIDWRRDYVNNVASGAAYCRLIPYLDFTRVGDHKIIWELNRHQHLVLLAQAYRLTGRQEFFGEILAQLESWFATNPYMRGINWASALEVALRALSWIWVFHWAGEAMEPDFRQRFLAELYRHGCYLEHNLSIYFSPNTHLLGEAVVLHALGVLFPKFPKARKWERLGAQIVREQVERQVREDGSHFEQSSYYHVYAMDLFLLHQALAETSPAFRAKLEGMAEYLAALLGPSGKLPLIGDDDGGRVEKVEKTTVPFSTFSRLFPQAGLAVMMADHLHVLVDAGPFGAGTAGHSHSDTLSLVVRLGKEEILIDPGTYTYVADPQLRNWFRGSAAHNTVRVDGMDQAIPAGPFSWKGRPSVEVRQWLATPAHDFLDAACYYAGFTHRRSVLLLKPDLILVLDEIEGPQGEHLVEQFWLPGEAIRAVSDSCFQIGERARLAFPAAGRIELSEGWRSRCFASKEPSPVIRVSQKCSLPLRLAALLDLAGREKGTVSFSLERANQVQYGKTPALDLFAEWR